MSLEIKQSLGIFLSNFIKSTQNDILRNIDLNYVIPYSNELDLIGNYTDVIKKAKKIEKEIGINPLCKSVGLLNYKIDSGSSIRIPVFLKEIKIISQKNELVVEDLGSPFLNPYLNQLFQLKSNSNISTFEELYELNSFDLFDLDETAIFIGNFHPFRFEIFRDITEIIRLNRVSKDLGQLLMIDNGQSQPNLGLCMKPILQLDFSQKKALESLKLSSLLVHGPPGTGKSQLIGNVIGSALNSNLSILVSSEKKASLDAVYKRLEKVGLQRFCLLNYSKNENKILIRDLKKTWDFLSKEQSSSNIQFENKYSYTEVIRALINRPKIENFKIKNLISKLGNSDALFYSELLNFEEIKENEYLLNAIDVNLFHLTYKLNFNRQWNEKNLFEVISECEKHIELATPYNLVETIDDLDQLVRKLLIIEGFSNTIYQKYGDLISKKSKKIKRLFFELVKIEKNNLKWSEIPNHWIKFPSEKEIALLIELASKKSFIDRLKFKIIWKKWVRTTELEPISTCNEMLNYLLFQKEKSRFSIELAELGIESIHDLKLIYDLIISHSIENWNWYINLNEDLKQNFKNVHSHVSRLKLILAKQFNFKNEDKIIFYLSQIKENKTALLTELTIIEKLPNSISELLQKCSSMDQFYNQLYLSIWKSTFGNLEIPTSLAQKEWIRSAVRFEKNKLQISKGNSIDIIQNIKYKFDYYQILIETPNRKLNEEEQKLKTELKIGKSILIKEFGKVKQHLNLRKLYESEAKKWLIILKPILMMHPLRIATYFPPEPGLFDLGIIDEASQMPLKNAIGTLQRVNRILIAGDENQMDPSYFFSTNDNEHSVFHQAKYHLNNIELTHHYRCESEELISFSNRYFYENKLRFIEQANSTQKQRIHHHFIKTGNYHDSVNENEAEKVADFLVNRIDSSDKEISFGIVAFSEAQLNKIIQKIPSRYTTIIDELEESNRVFFKTLDQVQGDECDELIISFGYGKNKEGNFEMRFGPINQIGGEKRLNVLLSRAKKEIHFFSSVRYNDFPQTKNGSVLLLKNWFAMLEDSKITKVKSFEINVFDILEQAKDVDDFTFLIYQYNERGWKILTT
jgi:hypothetical protein